jgi:hypothetical protein
MMDDFLTDQEKNYILSKAELIRVSQRIELVWERQ